MSVGTTTLLAASHASRVEPHGNPSCGLALLSWGLGFGVFWKTERVLPFPFCFRMCFSAAQGTESPRSHMGEASSFADSMQHPFLQWYHLLP